MTTKTWLITGASRGFGLAEAALAAGNNVVAAVRRPADVAGSQDGRTSVPGLAAPRPLTRRCTHARSAASASAVPVQ
ncbi:hypothetical protein [Kribbella steppae]|uniref:hypothetical protein n=1 Tax=Kribbella steppae TaxID=2512223 RepID=UPI0018EE489F|nr:hypothetical protein [Kribbella steppae]